MHDQATAKPAALRARLLRVPIVRLFASIKFGVTLLALILIYATIGSALAPVRGVLEMSEMDVFHHWLFVSLIALFCAAILVTSLVRIRWSWLSAGALITHLGLLLLAFGSWQYFDRKVEGDLLLVSPRIEVLDGTGRRVPDAAFLAAEGESRSEFIPVAGDTFTYEVIAARPAGELSVAEAILRVRSSAGEQLHTLRADDARPVRIADNRFVRLRNFPTVSTFFRDDAPALHVGEIGEPKQFAEIDGLPWHRERYLPGDGVLRDSAGRFVWSKRPQPLLSVAGLAIPTGWFERWKLPIDVNVPDVPFDVRVTGYVPYVATFEARPQGGGSLVNPMVAFRLSAAGQHLDEALAALDPRRSQLDLQVPIEFRWVDSSEQLPQVLKPLDGPHELTIRVVEPAVSQTLAVQRGQSIELAGTPYTVTVDELEASAALPETGLTGVRSPVATVTIRNGEQALRRRIVARFPDLAADAGSTGGPGKRLLDENIRITYRCVANGKVLILAGPELPPSLAVFQPDGRVQPIALEPDRAEPVQVGNFAFEFTLRRYFARGRWGFEPVIQPLEQRQPNVGRRASAIRVELTGRGELAGWRTTRWLPFNDYPTLDPGTQALYGPVRAEAVQLPDGRNYELLYSRMPVDLGATLVPGKLVVDFFPGRQRAETWHSDFHVRQPDGRLVPAEVYTNQTFNVGEWTLFQANAAGDHWSWTGLGVGNRHGMWPMIIGSLLITLGAMYAFYVKPVLRRRLRQRGAPAAAPRESGLEETIPARMPAEV